MKAFLTTAAGFALFAGIGLATPAAAVTVDPLVSATQDAGGVLIEPARMSKRMMHKRQMRMKQRKMMRGKGTMRDGGMKRDGGM